MAEIKAAPLVEGGHWYTREGEPAYTQTKADGSGERPTTLRDAKKLGLQPSVTTILSVLDKPQLTLWKVRTAIRAASEVARGEKEELDAWVDRVVEKAGEPVAEAADLGTRIHDAIECAVRGEEWDTAALGVYVAPALAWLVGMLAKGWRIEAVEKVVVNAEEGYAGRVDMVLVKDRGEDEDGRVLVVDWKSRKTRATESDAVAFAPYPTQRMQGAAYAAIYSPLFGWANVATANAITSSTEPGRFGVVYHDAPEETFGAWLNVLAIWRWVKGYDPRKKGQ